MAVQLSNQIFSISIGDYGDISSLRLTGDTFNTNYVMNGSNAPKQNTSDHQWLGELMFTYRLGNGAWTRAWTSNSADVRQIISSGNSVQVSYQNSSNHQGIRNFTLQETYSLVNDYLHWQMKVTNTSNQALEIGDWGLPLPFNEYWSGGNNEQIYETRVLSHSFVGHHSSFITAGRPSGIGPYILLLPDAATGAGLEYQDHWRVEEHPGSTWAMEQGGWSEGLNVFYIHSNVIKSTNRGYLGSNSLSLAPGESKTYAFKFYKVTDEQAVKDRLYSEGHVDVTVVPGMIVPTNLKAKFDLHTRKSITSVTAQYPSETTISYLENAPTNHKIYELTLGRLGHNNITVNYGNGEKTVLQFYAIEPVDTALQRHSTFMVNSTQWNVPGDLRDKVFDDWMMQYKAKRNSFAGYWGWGDDWGLTHGQFLAEKNVQKPVASEIKAVDDYLEVAIWTNLMEGHHTDYLVPDFLMPQPNTTPTYRGYAYPHIYNTFFSMYKLAKLYPNLVSYRNSKNTYLLRAYRIFKALYEGPVAYNWNTGLMGELTTPDMIKALQEEGLTTEANDMIAKMATKYNNFKNTTYPYGSEYNYDNTGEEAVYTLAKMNGNTTMMSKINAKTRAARGHMPVWYYYADPVTITGENWWNFQYTTSLAGYAMDDWTRRYSSKPEVDQRLSYAAKLANIGAINSGQISPDPANIGAVSWTYQAGKGNYGALGLDGGPLFNGWRGMSGEADLGLFGAIKILSSDVAVDPIFGLFGYGCDVTESNNSYTVTSKDGVFQRLHLITQKLSLELNRDQYTLAVVSKSKNNIRLMLKNTTPGTAHTTIVTITGLATGTYDVLVDGTKTGSVTAVNSAATTTSLNIGTAANYDIRIQSSTGNPAPAGDIIAHYEFNETAGSTAADSSGYGQQASVIGGSWSAGRNGNALRLNGIGAYASLPGGIVSSLNDFTIAAWVRVNTHNGWARLFDFGAGTDRYMFLTPKAEGTGMRFAITVLGNGEEQQLNAPELATGVWKHVAVTLSGTTGIMYVDGIEATRNTGMTLRPSSLGLTDWNYIGKSQFDDPYLNGAVDELIIYNRALTAQEIRGLASASSTITAHDLRVQAYAEGAD